MKKRILIDIHRDKYDMLFSAVIQQAIIDIDECIRYRKKGMTYYTRGNSEKVNTEKEYQSILKFLHSESVKNFVDFDVDTVINMLHEKNKVGI